MVYCVQSVFNGSTELSNSFKVLNAFCLSPRGILLGVCLAAVSLVNGKACSAKPGMYSRNHPNNLSTCLNSDFVSAVWLLPIYRGPRVFLLNTNAAAKLYFGFCTFWLFRIKVKPLCFMTLRNWLTWRDVTFPLIWTYNHVMYKICSKTFGWLWRESVCKSINAMKWRMFSRFS